jgi:hypothetical protein
MAIRLNNDPWVSGYFSLTDEEKATLYSGGTFCAGCQTSEVKPVPLFEKWKYKILDKAISVLHQWRGDDEDDW